MSGAAAGGGDSRYSQDVKQNTADIRALTKNVTELSIMSANHDRRFDEVLQTMKDVVTGINRLAGIEKDVASIKDTMGEHMGDIRAVRHEVMNVKNAALAIPVLNDKIAALALLEAKLGERIDAHEKRISAAEFKQDQASLAENACVAERSAHGARLAKAEDALKALDGLAPAMGDAAGRLAAVEEKFKAGGWLLAIFSRALIAVGGTTTFALAAYSLYKMARPS